MNKEKKNKKEVADNQENFLLKKIRYYQGSVKDYETFWNEKISEGEREESPETKSFAKRNAELNKAFEIIPVEQDDDVICVDVVSGKGVVRKPEKKSDETSSEPEKKEEKHEEEEETKVKDEKKEKKEEKKVENEEETVEDAKKEEKGEDDEDDDKKKSKKKDKED